MSASKLDAVYRSILLTKFFTKGWGKPENLRRLFEFRKIVSNRDKCFELVEKDYPVTITKEQNLTDCKLLEGYFTTPLEKYLPGIVPEIAQRAHFQILLPVHWSDPKCKPVCLHLAGTGDHFFWRRRNLMVKPLLKEAGIGGIILENPFYGLRKPTDQVRSSLHNVSDIFVMGGCLILESLVLLHWCEKNGLGPLGVTGLSMGGHMASLAATNWPKPLVLVPCLSWSTASAVFLQGVMSQSINWDLLEDQYLSDGEYREKLSKMVTIIDEAFLAGKKFARTYSERMENNQKPMASEKNTLKYDLPCNNLDITYKETPSDNNNNEKIDTNTNLIDLNKNLSNSHTAAQTSITLSPQQLLKKELKRLLNKNKISPLLYEKLTSNKTFDFEPHDIEEVNKLNEENIKEMLLKCNINILELQSVHKSSIEHNANGPELTTTPATIDADKSTHLENTTSEKLTLENATESNNNKSNAVQDDSAKNATALVPAAIKDKNTKIGRKSWNVSDLTSDLWVNLPFLKGSEKKLDIGKVHWRDRETLQFMRGIMDECTHLSNFSVPFDTSLIIAVCAQHDAYVPRDDVGTLEEIWPGAEVRYVDAGHVSAYILHQSLFRSCIKEAFERSKKRWKDGKHID